MPIDPRRLRPAELCRLLNSTPLGEVINTVLLRHHRERAGLPSAKGDMLIWSAMPPGSSKSGTYRSRSRPVRHRPIPFLLRLLSERLNWPAGNNRYKATGKSSRTNMKP